MKKNDIDRTIVIGHKNPDTDSISSAVGYAAFKKKQGLKNVLPGCAGLPNARTEFLFNKFKLNLPILIKDVYPRIKDIMNVSQAVVRPDQVLLEAMEIIQKSHKYRVPIVSNNDSYLGMVSLFDLSNRLFNTSEEMTGSQGFLKREVRTSIELASRTLSAEQLTLYNENSLEVLNVYVAAMSLTRFRNHILEQKPENLIIVVGDREDIQYMAVELQVRLLIVTSNSPIGQGIIEIAREKGTSILKTNYDSASTVRRLKFSTPVDNMVQADQKVFNVNDKVSDVRRIVMNSPDDIFPVLNNKGKFKGIFTKNDLNKTPRTKLVLVDHNEIDQSVDGTSEVPVIEVLDHHRINMEATINPITINFDVVGSTCTLVSEKFKNTGLPLSNGLAGILMGGIISDTLLLRSPTSTPRDAAILKWLEKKADTSAKKLAEEFFNIGSLIASLPPNEVLTSDKKNYDVTGIHISIAQTEESSFDNFNSSADNLLKELKKILNKEKLNLFALLVTNITDENSLLLVDGDKHLLEALPYKRLSTNLFDLPGILSRKKQLLPQLLKVLPNAE